jgi:AraC family transcriptional regulator
VDSTRRQFETPRIEQAGSILIVGMRERYTVSTMAAIPVQWERFAARLDQIPGQVGRATYGLCFNMFGNAPIEYLSGVEVSGFSDVPADLSRATVPRQRYAIFPHRAHVSQLHITIDTILREWLPGSGHQLAHSGPEAPDFFERYGEEFNPSTGSGGIEVWIPLAA